MAETQARVAVIIPFYQREAGVLGRAVESVLAQEERDLRVVVVDDGSPAPARDELGDTLARDPRVEIIEQENGGPAAARNRGLDAVPPEVPYIALLDSDDRWVPGHLRRGFYALEHGADFYFADADHSGRDMEASRFAHCGLGPAAGRPIEGSEDTFLYEGDFFEAIQRLGPVGTSTVLFRKGVAPDLRFPLGFTIADDTYFWLEFALRTNRIAFSTRCDVLYGRGVNIYASARWGTSAMLRNLLDFAKLNRRIVANLPLNAEQRQRHARGRADLRRSFAENLLHLLRHRKEVDWRTVRAYAAEDPRFVGDVIGAIGRRLVGRT